MAELVDRLLDTDGVVGVAASSSNGPVFEMSLEPDLKKSKFDDGIDPLNPQLPVHSLHSHTVVAGFDEIRVMMLENQRLMSKLIEATGAATTMAANAAAAVAQSNMAATAGAAQQLTQPQAELTASAALADGKAAEAVAKLTENTETASSIRAIVGKGGRTL